MKRAFLISGFNMSQHAGDPKYSELRQAIANKGYKVIPVPIYWNRKTISEYVDEFIDFYNQHKSSADSNIIIGGSYGAMVAFLSAPILQPEKVLVCSLSAYFKEDMSKQKQSYMIRRFGKRRTADSHIISAGETARKLNKTDVRVVFMIGAKENWGRFLKLRERVRQSAHVVKNCKLVVIPNCPHPFRHPEYVAAIAKEI